MTNEEIGKILRDNLKVVPKTYDMHGMNFNCDCHLEITEKGYYLIGNGNIESGIKVVENYLQRTNGYI